jgi:hypothetical protein
MRRGKPVWQEVWGVEMPILSGLTKFEDAPSLAAMYDLRLALNQRLS